MPARCTRTTRRCSSVLIQTTCAYTNGSAMPTLSAHAPTTHLHVPLAAASTIGLTSAASSRPVTRAYLRSTRFALPTHSMQSAHVGTRTTRIITRLVPRIAPCSMGRLCRRLGRQPHPHYPPRRPRRHHSSSWLLPTERLTPRTLLAATQIRTRFRRARKRKSADAVGGPRPNAASPARCRVQ